MEWTIEQLDKLDNDITKLYLHSEMSDESLADVMGKIDTKRYEINLANGVITGDELALPIPVVVLRSEQLSCVGCRYNGGDDDLCGDCGDEYSNYTT